MKIQTEKGAALLAQTDKLCDAMAKTDAEEFMAYLGVKYPEVAIELYALMKANIEFGIAIL